MEISSPLYSNKNIGKRILSMIKEVIDKNIAIDWKGNFGIGINLYFGSWFQTRGKLEDRNKKDPGHDQYKVKDMISIYYIETMTINVIGKVIMNDG